ncbi:MAG: pyridoxamine 5'-phosphate oxidase family protein [Acidimicrobiales bacterium]
MSLSEQDLDFLTNNHSAAMITVGRDGAPKAARVGVALVDGKLWSSGTADRVRTRRLRRDPRCTLFVYDAGYAWLALETSVTILDGPDAAERNVRLFRVMQDRPTGPLSWFGGELAEDDFLQSMADEGRLVYEFEVHHTYGLH